jgi:hypothetical protein
VRHSVDYGRYFENLMQNIGTVTNGFPEAVPFEAVANRDNYNPQAVRDNLMFGTPDEVIEKLQVYEDAGVDQYCLGLSFNLPFELQVKTLRLFIDEVMPHFAARERRSRSRRRAAPLRGTEMGTATQRPARRRRMADEPDVGDVTLNYRLQGNGSRWSAFMASAPIWKPGRAWPSAWPIGSAS